jgi:glutamate carboxypeptidase
MKIRPLRPWLLLAALAISAIAHAADERLLAAARAAQPAVIDSLREMVMMESGSQDAAGLKSMADYVEARLRALGASTERTKAGIGPGEMVKGTFAGTGKRNFLLIAHMDTVYGKGILATEPYRQDGNKLYGPGIADDKGGIAVILHSLAILRDAGWKDHARLTVLFNPDEEIGSIGSGETIAALGDAHDVVLSYEPTAAKAVAKEEGVLLMAAGVAQARLAVQGVASHAGAAPEQGRNALIELSYQLLQTQDVAKGIAGAQLNWTTVEPITTRNQIPDRAVAGGDVRLLAPDAADKLLAALRTKVAESRRVPDTETSATLQIMRPPYVAGTKGMALATKAQAIYAELDGR